MTAGHAAGKTAGNAAGKTAGHATDMTAVHATDMTAGHADMTANIRLHRQSCLRSLESEAKSVLLKILESSHSDANVQQKESMDPGSYPHGYLPEMKIRAG